MNQTTQSILPYNMLKETLFVEGSTTYQNILSARESLFSKEFSEVWLKWLEKMLSIGTLNLTM